MHIELSTEQAIDRLMAVDAVGDTTDATIGEWVMMSSACRAIVEHLEAYENDSGESLALDPVGIRCAWSGVHTLDDFAESYDIDTSGVDEHDRDEFILDYLQGRTMVLHVSDDHYVLEAF